MIALEMISTRIIQIANDRLTPHESMWLNQRIRNGRFSIEQGRFDLAELIIGELVVVSNRMESINRRE